MAKKAQLDIVEDNDGDVIVDLNPTKKSREFKGSDANPVDAETGETVFDDINPRFAATRFADAEADEDKTPKEEDESEDVEEEDESEDEAESEDTDEESSDEDTDEETTDSDTVDEEPRRGKWSKRLDRAERVTQEARAEAAAVRKQLAELNAKLQSQADDTAFKAKKAELEGKLAGARLAMKKAIEDGNSDAQVAAQEEMSNINGDIKVLTVQHDSAAEQLKETAARKKTSSVTAMKSAAWVRQHPRFNRDPEFKAIANALDEQVARDGFDSETDAYFDELNARMAKYYPKEFKAKTKDAPVKRKHPASGQSREDSASTPGKKPVAKKNSAGIEVKNGKAVLTQRHIQTMRDFRLDPDDPNDVREFVRNNLK